ncbi:MAG: Lrp/AsnC ligand binding domain-containing protein [Paludibacteraceae bacterium]|jgi:Lrp/AsnC family transcriptional regulator for asnA, asnC and gidA|nr:Lrp/AsnC ligand binding domain-containing protein [Paludibacteraceae bacterium]
MTTMQLDQLDEKILQMVSRNARTPFLEIARECNVSGAAIHQRIQKLTQMGVITGSEFIVDPEKVGYHTCAYMGLYLKDANDFKHVVASLYKIPEVVECHYTTGKYALYLKIYAKDNKHFLSIIHDKIQSIPGIASTETLISLGEAFRRQITVEGFSCE